MLARGVTHSQGAGRGNSSGSFQKQVMHERKINHGKEQKPSHYRNFAGHSIRRNRRSAGGERRPVAGKNGGDTIAGNSLNSAARTPIPRDSCPAERIGCQCQLRAPRFGVKVEPCFRCGNDCDGSLIRHDTRYWRVHNIITAPEIPRFADGIGIQLCHICQRAISFRRGLIEDAIMRLGLYASDARKAPWPAAFEQEKTP